MHSTTKDNEQPPELLTISQVAVLLRVSKNTLRAWDKKGILKAVLYGIRKDRKYLRRDVEALLKKEA